MGAILGQDKKDVHDAIPDENCQGMALVTGNREDYFLLGIPLAEMKVKQALKNFLRYRASTCSLTLQDWKQEERSNEGDWTLHNQCYHHIFW